MRKPELMTLAFLALLGIAVTLRFVPLFTSMVDEGMLTEAGFRTLHGQIPYRDFTTHVAPLPLALTSLSLAVGGPTVLAPQFRMYQAVTVGYRPVAQDDITLVFLKTDTVRR
ncbi:MAG: hypothetical protein ACYCW6_02015 [Candidatus Xenobia bacterium]